MGYARRAGGFGRLLDGRLDGIAGRLPGALSGIAGRRLSGARSVFNGTAGRDAAVGNSLRLALGVSNFLTPPSCVGSVREGSAQAMKSIIGPKRAIRANTPPYNTPRQPNISIVYPLSISHPAPMKPESTQAIKIMINNASSITLCSPSARDILVPTSSGIHPSRLAQFAPS